MAGSNATFSNGIVSASTNPDGSIPVDITFENINASQLLVYKYLNYKENPDVAVIVSALNAIGEVIVDYDSEQSERLIAVETYVNDLLTGPAAGITANVTPDDDGTYEVELSKGLVSATITITVTEAYRIWVGDAE